MSKEQREVPVTADFYWRDDPRTSAARETDHEWRCPVCGATTRARMADHDHPVTAEPTGDLREQMLREMLRALCVDHGHDRRLGGMNCRTCRRRVDVLLALPEVRDALAAQEAVKRVEALADRFAALADSHERGVARLANGEYRADQLGLAMGYTRAAIALRRALAGDQ